MTAAIPATTASAPAVTRMMSFRRFPRRPCLDGLDTLDRPDGPDGPDATAGKGAVEGSDAYQGPDDFLSPPESFATPATVPLTERATARLACPEGRTDHCAVAAGRHAPATAASPTAWRHDGHAEPLGRCINRPRAGRPLEGLGGLAREF